MVMAFSSHHRMSFLGPEKMEWMMKDGGGCCDGVGGWGRSRPVVFAGKSGGFEKCRGF